MLFPFSPGVFLDSQPNRTNFWLGRLAGRVWQAEMVQRGKVARLLFVLKPAKNVVAFSLPKIHSLTLSSHMS